MPDGLTWVSDFLQSSENFLDDTMGFNKDAFINIGYSTGPMLAAILGSAVLVALPPLFAFFYRLNRDMPLMGANSLVISAACQVPGRAGGNSAPVSPMPDEESAQKRSLIVEEYHTFFDGEKQEPGWEDRVALARGRLKWGVVGDPTTRRFRGEQRSVGHLGFGGEDDEVCPPRGGDLYE